MGINVQIAHDPEAAVWFIESSDLPGLSGAAPTVEALIERIPGMIADLIEENGSPEGTDASEVTVEIIARARVRVPHAA